MKLTVAICTHNRADKLTALVKAYAMQFNALPDEVQKEIELVIVDNNSSDKTKELVFACSAMLGCRYFFEARQGLSFARNRAIREADGEYIAFLDDDVELSKNWLTELISLVVSEKASVYSARVLPRWQSEQPEWLNFDNAKFSISQSVLPAHDYGAEAKTYPFKHASTLVQNPIGANLIFKRDLFLKYGDFQTQLGAGQRLALNEDTEFCRYLNSMGEKILYSPSCIVYHPVDIRRTQKSYIKNWYKTSGSCFAWMKKHGRMQKLTQTKSSGLKLFSVILAVWEAFKLSSFYTALKLVIFYTLFAALCLSRDPQKIFWAEAQLARVQGELSERLDSR